MVGDNNKRMHEQEINYHYSPSLGQQQKQIVRNQQLHSGRACSSMSAAIRSQRLVCRYLPPSSLIQQQHSLSSSLLLYRAQPIFRFESSLYDRQRLSMQRQLMYCRGLGDQFTCDDIVEELIQQSQQQKGYINKRGNRSIVVNQLLVYAYKSCIKAIQLPKYNNNLMQMYQQTLAPITLLTFTTGTNILQLQQLTHSKNNKHNLLLISIRLSRQIVIFNLLSGQIVNRITTQSSSEFIACGYKNSVTGPNILQTVEYDGCDTLIKLWHLNNSNTPLTNKSIKIQTLLVNSIDKLTTNTSLLASYDGLRLHDQRLNKVTTQYKPPNQQRLYSMQRLTGQYTYSPYIATSHTRHISLFDIRNFSKPIQRRPHHCEQSPHQIMTYFDGCGERLDKPVIMCWSPYDNGSALMVNANLLDTDGFSSCKSIICQKDNTIFSNNNDTTTILGENFNILPHNLHSPSNNHFKPPLYTDSISLHNYSSSSLTVLAISNQGTINMHMYYHSQDNDKYYPQALKQSEQKQTLNSQYQQEIQKFSINLWFKNNQLQKYFTKDITYQQITSQQRKPSTSKAFNKKKNKTKNNRLKSYETQSILVKSLERNHQEQLLFQSQFQNEDQCEQSYQKRKLNFVDLTHFYQTLSIKAKHYLKSPITKPNQLESSFASTQPYSETYSLSQSFSDDSFTHTNLLNKKIINSSLLDHLKSQWDQ